ncbi:MAG: hypothetical protein HYV75_04400, partial [Opitutae bacterium]|nr:hypothetical protein [Opitutae bacterium]
VAVATVAVAVENNIGGTTAAELRTVADTVIAAVPDAAPEIAALVQVSAPSQSQTIIESTRTVAPEQTAVVEQTVRDTPPATTPPATTTPPPAKDAPPPPPPTTTPQPIDPSTVSRSG